MATRRQKAPDVIDVAPTESQELVTLRTDGEAVRSFVGGLVVFFGQAQTLERRAKDNLAAFEKMGLPTTGDEDASLQQTIRAASLGKKELEGHWTITAIVSRVHRQLTGMRARGTDAYDRAIQIGNTLHNRYADAERARARQEEDRLRREAEDRAQADRERELAALEHAALKAEASRPDLSDREERFVTLYVGSNNAPAAAREAGYKDPDTQALKLLRTAKIQTAIQTAQEAFRLRQQAAAVRQAPVEVEAVTVRPDVAKGGERTTWSAELLDERRFVQAVVSAAHGIPLDCLTVNQAKLNELARSLHEQIDRWPGVRAKKATRVV